MRPIRSRAVVLTGLALALLTAPAAHAVPSAAAGGPSTASRFAAPALCTPEKEREGAVLGIADDAVARACHVLRVRP